MGGTGSVSCPPFFEIMRTFKASPFGRRQPSIGRRTGPTLANSTDQVWQIAAQTWAVFGITTSGKESAP